MREELQSLKRLIHSDALRMRDIKNGKVILKEPKNDQKTGLSQVELYNLPAETVVFSLDHSTCKTSGYLSRGGEGWNKGCDYVIATHDGTTGWLLACELKSRHTGGAIQQLKSADAFATYLDALLSHFLPGRLTKYERRHVLFYQRDINKRGIGKAPLQVQETDKLKMIKVDRHFLRIEELFLPAK